MTAARGGTREGEGMGRGRGWGRGWRRGAPSSPVDSRGRGQFAKKEFSDDDDDEDDEDDDGDEGDEGGDEEDDEGMRATITTIAITTRMIIITMTIRKMVIPSIDLSFSLIFFLRP